MGGQNDDAEGSRNDFECAGAMPINRSRVTSVPTLEGFETRPIGWRNNDIKHLGASTCTIESVDWSLPSTIRVELPIFIPASTHSTDPCERGCRTNHQDIPEMAVSTGRPLVADHHAVIDRLHLDTSPHSMTFSD